MSFLKKPKRPTNLKFLLIQQLLKNTMLTNTNLEMPSKHLKQKLNKLS